jgi:ribosomal protein S18 acetylase RimI-like enzyme
MNLRRPNDADRTMMAEFAAALQVRPEHHVAYLGLDADTIADDMIAEDDDWTEAAVIAEGAGGLSGWLMGSVDHDMGRVWWFGPFVDSDDPTSWRAVADALDDAVRAVLGPHVTEEEYAFDNRHLAAVGWALDRGAVEGTGASALVLDGPLDPPKSAVRFLTDDDIDVVGRLHDELFPGAHTTGAALGAGCDDDHLRIVIEDDGGVSGYVAVERQADGGGYIDFLGVAPEHRRMGLGAELIRAGVAALRDLGCERVSLTVRTDNLGARSLYTGLGFVEERVYVPLRVGFSLG